ncbi:MAG TPA: D-glycero-beta-D-manno-heptose 1-phosphate adenylyltransferase [Fimbriimonadaceae bacterium]|nr:D-glycero-beta-D-manno-heptose 1-phosphate adenylyltransferase [Fimbriimonadaceae bacterium]
MVATLEDVTAARAGKTVVFTNGVFDVLHAGHVSLLERAKGLGDILVVGLNTDESARRLGKGSGRPVNALADRAAVVAALRAVDFVLAFDENTPVQLIERLRPDVHVKGGDYEAGSLPEAPTVRSYGGKVVVLPLLEGHSSTSILKGLGLE